MVAMVVALGLIVPGMAMASGGMSAGQSACQAAQAGCIDHACIVRQAQGHSRYSQMAPGCYSVACFGSVSLPASATAAPRVYFVATYHPLIMSRIVGVRALPGTPPPKPLALS